LEELSNYRMDNRTKEQFIDDIRKGTERERLAITLFKHYVRREFSFTGDIKENGVDMTGDFIEEDGKVTTGADYSIGKNELPLEVKTSVGHNSVIYLKSRQIDAYIKQGASILYVNGIEGDVPAFTLWTVEDLKQMKRTLEPTTPPGKVNGGKLSYRVVASDYRWSTFGGRERKYARY
jgi:hypothetical protein